MKTLTVVCPVYNEEQGILAFHGELAAALRGLSARWRSTILYVVDGSRDRSGEILRSLAATDQGVRLLLLSGHFGQQAALMAGLDHCDSDAVIMMDSDLQHPPAMIPALLAEYENGKDVVYTVREEDHQLPFLKRLSARIFYRLLNSISGTPIHQGAADFRLVSRRVVQVFQNHVHERSLFLRGLFNWVGFARSAVRFRPAPRRAGRSNYSLGPMLDFAADGIVGFSRTPLRAALLAGTALVAAALAGGLVLALASLAGSAGGVWPLALLFAFLTGVQLTFLGVLGEYLARVLDEVRGRPRYLVDERINFPPSGPPAEHDPAERREPAVARPRGR
jgi:dolichol-phosphate mannosyltransferase